ncbi:hypothetical protein SSX86_031424 [Deinandra increscens subsp. villosa]|uniref:Uncharacterized protein n=1 Tax=Deinandra increscens subsp. villosa TaxID=3103831 RepID=A0AAP0C8Z4_9ASTR
MAPNTVALIRQVDKIRNDYQLKVRIIQLWKLPVFNNPTETFGIEMILMDEEGNKMQASVFKKCVVHFEKILAERACFFVDCPLVAANDSKYRYLDGPYKLIFGDRTRLRRCVDFSGSLYGFSFVSFAPILKTATPAHEVVDVIAHVTKIYELEKVPVKGNKTTERLNLDVQDSEKRQVRMTLWGDFATQLVNYVSANLDKGILIIILQFGKVNYYRDLPYFSNLFGISRLIINGDLPEVASMLKGYLFSYLHHAPESYIPRCVIANCLRPRRLQHENDGSDNTGPPKTLTSIMHTLQAEFLNTYDSICISGISAITMEKKTVVVGTIMHVANNLPWYYAACTVCGHKVVEAYDEPANVTENMPDTEEKKILTCTNANCPTKKCPGKEIVQVPRFKVQVRIEDATGFVYVTMFDGDVARIIQATAREMTRKYQEVTEPISVPVELDALLGKKFAFLIDITSYNFKRNCPIYGVAKLTANVETITELENRLGLLEVSTSDIIFILLTRFLNSSSQGVGSSNVGNSTPVSTVEGIVKPTFNAKDKMPMVEPSRHNLKRNLSNAYDTVEAPSVPHEEPTLVTKRANTIEEGQGMTPI